MTPNPDREIISEIKSTRRWGFALTLLFGIGSLLAVSACVALPTAERFEDREGSYRFKPPTGWDHTYLEEATVQFFSPIADENYKPGLLVFRGPGVQAGGVGGYRYAAEESDRTHTRSKINESAILEAIKKEKDQAKVVEDQHLSINGADVYLVIYKHRFQQLDMRAAEATLVDFKTGNDFIILFNTLDTTFDKHYPLFRQSLSTFTPSSKQGYNHQLLIDKESLRSRATVREVEEVPFKPSSRAFLIKPPKGWLVKDQGDLVSFSSAEEQQRPRAVILISRSRVSGSVSDEYKDRTQTERGISSWLKQAGYELKSIEELKVAGYPTLRIRFQGVNLEKETVRGIIYRILTPVAYYDIKFSTEPSLFDKALSTFELSLATFSLGEWNQAKPVKE